MLEEFVNKLDLGIMRKIPQVLQSEVAECGLACLVMISYYYGLKIDLLTLRQRVNISTNGTTIPSLIEIGHQLNLKARILSLDMDELSQLNLPCILHWNMNHFVVLVKVKRNRFIIHDPAFGHRVLNLKEMSSHFTGVALEFWPDSHFIKKNEKDRIKVSELFKNIKGINKFLLKLFILSTIVEILNLLIPIGTQLVMDHVVISKDNDLLLLICLGLISFSIFRSFTGLIRSWLSITMSAIIDVQWKTGLFDYLMKLPLAYFEKRKLGDIQSRFNSIDLIRSTFTDTLVKGIIDSVMIICVFIMMLLYGGWLLWIVVCFTLIYIVIRVVTYNYYSQISHEQIVKSAIANSHFMETLYGISTLKSLGNTENRTQHWLNLNIDAINSRIKIEKFDTFFQGTNVFISTIEQITILWLATNQVINDAMTIGMFIAFNAYRGQFAERASMLIDVLLQFRLLSIHNERLSDIVLTQQEEQKELLPKINLDNKGASLEVKNISFSYDTYSKPIIADFSLQINAGESIAIIGPSGVGKTTLMKLMSGLLQPMKGVIIFNGIDIRTLGLNNYRNNIACVLQDDKLFSGTIAENIAGFSASWDQELIEKCAVLSNIHQDIMKFPMKYNTLLSELGGTLSGGQKQRLLIARALYRQPGILFMDEATSHLDSDNEHIINSAISALSITRVIIAHRQSTIASADRVVTLSLNK